MTQKDGDYWVASFEQAPLNAIFHNNQGGDSNQTGNIEGLSGDNYFTYDGTSGYTTESAPVPDPTPQPGGKTTIYVKSATAPYLYVWDGAGGEPNGAWPGAQMTQKDGDYWVASFEQAPLNAIFHNNQGGDSNQTGNIEGLSGDNYFTYDGTSGYTTESAPVPDPTPQPGKEITIYCESAQAPFIWAWDGDGNNLVSGEWPGEQLSATKVVGGRTFYYKTFTASSVNCIFSYTGDADKSADLGPFTSDQYFTFSAGNATNITSEIGGDTPTPDPQPSGKTTVYVKASSAPHLYAWYMDGETAVELNGAWPGTQLTQQSDGYWLASFDAAPINIIFNDGVGGTVGVNQTENIEGISGDNYFTYDGAGSYTKEGSTSIDSVPTVEFQTNNIYTIDGRRIRQNATSLQDLKPGVYIVGGKKIVKY